MECTESLLDEFIDEILSSKLTESSGYSKVTLQLMEEYDINIADCCEFINKSNANNYYFPLSEGISNILKAVGRKLTRSYTVTALLSVLLRACNKIMGSAIPVVPVSLLTGAILAVAQTRADPVYIEAKRRHKKNVCRLMTRKALLKVGLTGAICNILCMLFMDSPVNAALDSSMKSAGISISDTEKTASEMIQDSTKIQKLEV